MDEQLCNKLKVALESYVTVPVLFQSLCIVTISHYPTVNLEEVPRWIASINYFQIYSTETKIPYGREYALLYNLLSWVGVILMLKEVSL